MSSSPSRRPAAICFSRRRRELTPDLPIGGSQNSPSAANGSSACSARTRAISRSEALLASFERVTGCVAREQKLRHALAAITAEAQPLLQAGDPATRQGAQRILAAVDSLKE